MSRRNAPPRLLALVTDGYAGHGGIAQYNRDLLSALAESWSVQVLPRYDESVARVPDRVVQHPARRGRIGYAAAALWLGQQVQPQVVFAGHVQFSALARWVARRSGARLVIQAHGIDVWSAPRAWDRAAVEAADLILTVSRDTRRRVLSWSAQVPERVRVLPNTVRPLFAPGDRQAARQRYAPDAERVIVTVGRLSPEERYKGHDRVIASLPGLQRRWPGVRYLIAGRGSDRERLAALATELGVAAAVRFVDVPDPADLATLYRAADVMALPSTGEGFGIAFVEALRCGTPVLGLGVAGAADPLTLYPDGIATAETVEAVLTRLLATPVSALPLAALERRFGRTTFSTRAAALFDALIAGDPP